MISPLDMMDVQTNGGARRESIAKLGGTGKQVDDFIVQRLEGDIKELRREKD
jgi:hypothetical protein